ncbi:hypothetical protein MTO96_020293 [Rhipicephalus appendiculatus]
MGLLDPRRTALHYACSRGSAECASVLLQAHANPNLTDAQGRTPLHWVARCGSLAVAELLRANGALLSVLDFTQHRRTALDEASIHEDLSGWLRSRGAVGTREIRHAAAFVVQMWFRKSRKLRRLAVVEEDNSTAQGSRCLGVVRNMGGAALIIQSAWRRWAIRWRVSGAVADADEQAWTRALDHLQLLTRCNLSMGKH